MARRSNAAEDPGGTFYGWYVVAALFFSLFLGAGLLQGFGVFVKTWEEEWDVSTGTIAIAPALGVLLYGLTQPIYGRLIDRFGGRLVLIPSLAVVGLGAMALPLVGGVVGLILVFSLVVAVALGGVSPATTAAVTARWFQRRRGTAVSVLSAGMSGSGLVFIPFLAYLLVATDWQITWLVAGLIVLLLGTPLLFLILRNDPADIGAEPDGGAPDAEGTVTIPVPALQTDDWRDSLRSPPIWQLSLPYVICGVTTVAVSVHFIRWVESEGMSAGTGALGFALLSAVNLIGVLMIGFASDRFQRRTLLGAIYLVRAVAFVMLIVLPGNVAIWAFALIGGASWLPTVPLTAALTADIYGLRNMGVLGGFSLMAHQIGGSIAVLLFGLAFDAWGSYNAAFAVSAVLLVLAGLIAFSIQERRHSVRYATAAASGD